MYTAMGVCPLHMDSPEAKWTLDLCVNQTRPWPIHFSPVQAWPVTWTQIDAKDPGEEAGKQLEPANWQEAVLQNNLFTSHVMRPAEALVFSGSSQWHYRNALPAQAASDKCDLLFFHFIPAGTSELLKPGCWARLFNLPELEGLGHERQFA
jgi:hypothetical protein